MSQRNSPETHSKNILMKTSSNSNFEIDEVIKLVIS
jgi:hypothetical protein